MNLDDTQKAIVTGWIAKGLKLSEIQKQLETELGLKLTYMELRFLVDDLKVMPKDPEPPKQAEPVPPEANAEGEAPLPEPPPPPAEPGLGGGVSVTVDSLARPGALVSGNVKFSDNKTAAWYLDQTGRLGVVPAEQGYKPSEADVTTFQKELQEELQRLGM